MIQEARESRGITKRAAAKNIGMSESWWRKAELGWHKINGEVRPIRIAPEPLARAAHLVGLPPRKVLAAAGYIDADQAADIPTMRQDIHNQIDMFSDDHLPKIKAFLEGLRAGLQ